MKKPISITISMIITVVLLSSTIAFADAVPELDNPTGGVK